MYVCLELGYVEDEIFKKRQANDVSTLNLHKVLWIKI